MREPSTDPPDRQEAVAQGEEQARIQSVVDGVGTGEQTVGETSTSFDDLEFGRDEISKADLDRVERKLDALLDHLDVEVED